jgi:hypothetical protein
MKGSISMIARKGEKMFDARWNDSEQCTAAADDMMQAVSCLLTMTSGPGKVFVYYFDDDIKHGTIVKVYEIPD